MGPFASRCTASAFFCSRPSLCELVGHQDHLPDRALRSGPRGKAPNRTRRSAALFPSWRPTPPATPSRPAARSSSATPPFGRRQSETPRSPKSPRKSLKEVKVVSVFLFPSRQALMAGSSDDFQVLQAECESLRVMVAALQKENAVMKQSVAGAMSCLGQGSWYLHTDRTPEVVDSTPRSSTDPKAPDSDDDLSKFTMQIHMKDRRIELIRTATTRSCPPRRRSRAL